MFRGLMLVEAGPLRETIAFQGANVPRGFVVSHRRADHRVCEAGAGLVLVVVPPAGRNAEKTSVVCSCAVTSAEKRLRRVGVSEFERLGAEWLVVDWHPQANFEGYSLSTVVTVSCPYPEGSDAAVAWTAGRKKKISEVRQREGYDAEDGAKCPYPKDSAEAEAWRKGYRKKGAEKSNEVRRARSGR